jgi:hypothetical protein
LHHEYNFQRDHDDFRNWVTERWREAGTSDKQAKTKFSNHVALVEVPRCPFHVPGWTFGLWGEVTHDEPDPILRGSFRSQNDMLAPWILYPPCSRYESRLRNTANVILRKALEGKYGDLPRANSYCLRRVYAMLNAHQDEVLRLDDEEGAGRTFDD